MISATPGNGTLATAYPSEVRMPFWLMSFSGRVPTVTLLPDRSAFSSAVSVVYGTLFTRSRIGLSGPEYSLLGT
jgi:hypothetical protein